MASTAQYLTKLQQDKQSLINKYKQSGVDIDDSATFTDLDDKFNELPTSNIGNNIACSITEPDATKYDYWFPFDADLNQVKLKGVSTIDYAYDFTGIAVADGEATVTEKTITDDTREYFTHPIRTKDYVLSNNKFLNTDVSSLNIYRLSETSELSGGSFPNNIAIYDPTSVFHLDSTKIPDFNDYNSETYLILENPDKTTNVIYILYRVNFGNQVYCLSSYDLDSHTGTLIASGSSSLVQDLGPDSTGWMLKDGNMLLFGPYTYTSNNTIHTSGTLYIKPVSNGTFGSAIRLYDLSVTGADVSDIIFHLVTVSTDLVALIPTKCTTDNYKSILLDITNQQFIADYGTKTLINTALSNYNPSSSSICEFFENNGSTYVATDVISSNTLITGLAILRVDATSSALSFTKVLLNTPLAPTAESGVVKPVRTSLMTKFIRQLLIDSTNGNKLILALPSQFYVYDSSTSNCIMNVSSAPKYYEIDYAINTTDASYLGYTGTRHTLIDSTQYILVPVVQGYSITSRYTYGYKLYIEPEHNLFLPLKRTSSSDENLKVYHDNTEYRIKCSDGTNWVNSITADRL